MKIDAEKLMQAISLLSQEGQLRAVPDIEMAQQLQHKQLQNLLRRSDNANIVLQYLARYDACMRMIEIILLDYGYQLDEQPHASARTVVAALDASINFREIAKVRHDAKKQSIRPSQDALKKLVQLQKFLEDLISSNS